MSYLIEFRVCLGVITALSLWLIFANYCAGYWLGRYQSESENEVLESEARWLRRRLRDQIEADFEPEHDGEHEPT